MPNFSPPHNPVGLFEPSFMTNLYGASWSSAWNTCIYGSPVQTGADVLANCTGYAQGRALDIYREITGYNPAQSQTHPFINLNADPVYWLSRAQAAGLTVQQTPREGSILVTNDHVAIVETFDSSTGLYWISESGYNSDPYLYQQSMTTDGSGNWYSSYSNPSHLINGFILIPNVEPGPGPGPTPGRKSK